MLLLIELSRLQVELETPDFPFAIGHDEIPAEAKRIGDELDDIGGDGDARISERKEHVNSRTKGAEN